MATNRDVVNLKSELKITSAVSVGSTTGTWFAPIVDMRDFGSAMFQLTHGGSGTEGLTALTIRAATASNGSGDVATIKTIDLAKRGNPDARGDYLTEEILASDVMQKAAEIGKDYRYVGLYGTASNTVGSWVNTAILGDPRFAHEGLSGDFIS